MKYSFTKMHGIGNDFVVFDSFTTPISLTREMVRHIADRHYGIGCDQVLLLEPPRDDQSDVRYRIYNADGGEVMQCGNGARCAAVYLRQKSLCSKNEIIAETGAGILILKIEDDQRVRVNMGIPEFQPDKIPMVLAYEDSYQIKIDNELFQFGALSIGNPHAVIIVEDVEIINVEKIGMAIQQSGIFPESVNVGFIEIINNQAFKLRVYERGAGETLACGSGACAAMVSACQQGYLENQVDAELRGGHLSIQWQGEGEAVYMTGPATHVFDGTIEL